MDNETNKTVEMNQGVIHKECTLELFKQTRKEVRFSYLGLQGEDPSGTPAMVYLDSLDKYIGESIHICINPSDFNGKKIEDTGKKYYMVIDNFEYTSDDLNELESILHEWLMNETHPHQGNGFKIQR